ncbi:ankyrin repeat protein [Moumouvirus australiensis]|uniref:Ankyrin repeat protein n=1 Tax=Moumouvirus australiensis TaxID=2109587 RepID=A0A2P1EL29_9VIRU|nr:ankyrin repeat protein [Moumouvirus australiensis]AVL94601.1 ankyrin repeat protein [Moumouvirus australiensis]
MPTPLLNTSDEKFLDTDVLLNLDELDNSKLEEFLSDKLNVIVAIYFYCKLDMSDNLNYILNIIINHTKLYEYIKNNKAINDFLCLACNNNYYNIVKILLEFGANSNYLDAKPLLITVQQNNINIVELLLKYGIDINNINDRVLQLCCINNNFEIFKLFIDKGVYLLDSYKNLLDLCLENQSGECTKLLIKYSNDHMDYNTFNNSKTFDEEDFLEFSDD